MSTPSAEADAVLQSRSPEEFIRLLEPHARAFVEMVDPGSLDLFDVGFTPGAEYEVLRLRGAAPDGGAPGFGAQEAGMPSVKEMAISLLINILAAIAVTHVSVNYPETFSVLTVTPRPSHTPRLPPSEVVRVILVKSGLDAAERTRFEQALHAEPVLAQVIKEAKA